MTLLPSTAHSLCLDIETAADAALTIHKLALWRADTALGVAWHGPRIAASLARIEELSAGADCLLGHNIVRHDLPVLARRYPALSLLRLPVIDTLELSPLAFPANPYHSLVKDYKLVRATRNDPLKDAQLAYRLWQDQCAAFARLAETSPDELACLHYFLSSPADSGPARYFAALRGAPLPSAEAVDAAVERLSAGKVCPQQARALRQRVLADAEDRRAFAYVLVWLRVSGGNSVLPPWVWRQYPQCLRFIEQLRATPRGDRACPYCAEHLDPRRQLAHYFGFDAFRAEPCNAQGGSLQEEIVRAAYAGESALAILPTGGGKSICYQLPALSRYWRDGSLTVIVSPLQSLMKDQVDNLLKAGILSAATLNGLLTLPERRDVLDKIRLGDIGLLLVSPEQFRNRAFVEAIRQRQIATWVFDEAHCLSRWGNDFRPDYHYVARFIREGQARGTHAAVPVSGFTATAKREVIDDIRAHFQTELALELRLFDGGHERDNLHYEVMPVGKPEKPALIHRLLSQEFGAPEQAGQADGAIVFAASRKSSEELSAFLKDMGWTCAHFHAGLDAGLKKDIQQAFIAGQLKVIVATNAFGMGVDKPDVRLVIHAEIPGSLENYLQEAGRAGRDRQHSRCVLLYDEEDVEVQFGLSARSRLSRQDIAGILRALRRYARKTKTSQVVVTPGEILADEELETSVQAGHPDADTKFRTAIAWLERARLLERNENHTRVFPGCLKVPGLAEAETHLRRADFSDEVHARFRDLVSLLINARDDEGISTDELMLALGVSSSEVIRMLHQLERLGILSNDISLTVLLRHGVKGASRDRLQELLTLEKALLALLPELAADADDGNWQDVNQRALCQALKTRSGLDEIHPEQLMNLLRSLARPFGDGEKSRGALIEIRRVHRDTLKLKLKRAWSAIRAIAEKRRAVAGALLAALLAKLDERLRGVDLRVECKMGELGAALHADLTLAAQLRDETLAIDAGLLYLHDNGVLILDRGKSVFRSAMTIAIYPDERRGFASSDFKPLKEHYDEKNFQIHVMQQYARLGLQKLSEALAFVLAYFTLSKREFIERYFAGRREMLERATTGEAYQRIVDALHHPLQQRLVADRTDVNRLILAGPGSGKTRVIVHRVAFLVRVQREPPGSIIVLAFNRGAAREIRQRLRQLIAGDAGAVTVLTYHALAMRLTGTTLADLAERAGDGITRERLDAILERAIALLQGADAAPDGESEGDSDELRERLLAGYRHILVDEYQDIDARQYELISALAGRRTADADARLTLLAVGDDDQNIYAFRGTNNAFIQRFQEDYQAKVDYLIDNYRSSAHIIAAANALIAAHGGRLKAAQAIRIDPARRHAAPGGRWQSLDPLLQGRVQRLGVPADPVGQAVVVLAELMRLRALAADSDWGDVAVLARTRLQLEPFVAWCRQHQVPYRLSERDSAPRLYETREAQTLLDRLRGKVQRRLRIAVLRRALARGGAAAADNPWWQRLAQFIDEQAAVWGELAIPSATLIDELYEFSDDSGRAERGRLTLSTVHAAKGQEFAQVVILDGGEWRADAAERRLYYVGMTRAKENLILCQSAARAHPLLGDVHGDGVCVVPPPEAVARPAALSLRRVSLGKADVDLGFAGRCAAGQRVHGLLAGLVHGQRLQLRHDNGRTLLIEPESGVAIGALAKKFVLPAGEIVSVTLDTLVRRNKKQSDPEYLPLLRVDRWWAPLVTLTLRPAAGGA